MIQPGLRFHQFKKMEPAMVKEFATAAGDFNPLHHDEKYAGQSVYKGLIASGAQSTSLMLGVTATELSSYGPMVGLEFSFRFRKAVSATEKIKIEFLVVNVTEHKKLGGYLVDIRGRIMKADGNTALGAKGLVLIRKEAQNQSMS